ncbi:uncharacterized protein LOC118443462 isoform X3 [Vespa mandarinia]|uniref:uncharacterized protein LOC118443462 isoform X3 n=1 Tax=Vespa mandarinia TaxID=7446 RepID=UPI00160FA40F|nr:uncharacterized protein LOC118443462 isoform X3 [Vespa mandarinia]
MNCKVIPLKNHSEISYRVKCVAVENERVFGDVFVTHRTRNIDYSPIGYPFSSIRKTKKRNLIEQRFEGPDFMELNKKLPIRRASESVTPAIKRQIRRSKSIEGVPSNRRFEMIVDVKNDNLRRSPKKYPAPLAIRDNKEEVRVCSLVDQLLLDIYGFPSGSRSESDSTASSSLRQHPQHQYLQKARLLLKSKTELHVLIKILYDHINHTGGLLVRQLRRKDYLTAKRDKQCDIITANLQAHSAKRIEDTKMRFSLTPQPGESGFQQWLDAMKMVARLPGGIPAEFRKRLWLTLAERHLDQRGVDWKQAEKVCFNEWSNPDDEELGIQIVKDLHRTGCSLFCGAAGRDNQAVLRRVLLGFARWNKSVGYCQGLNVLAALVLQVMDRAESSAVKVMIYLIEGVLPEGYFADNLRGLSVDMAVFRDLLRSRMPKLSKHLEILQSDAKDKATGSSYEPPLTNVFTMQWFLTLFCHCLPQDAVLRVWDLIFLEGDQVLLRTALAIWESLSDRIMTVTSADEFYSIMGVLTREMLEFTNTNNLIKNIVSLGPLHGVTGLREKHRYNITPWARKLSDDEDSDTEEDERLAVAAAMFSMAQRLKKGELLSEHISSTVGAIQAMAPGNDRERLALDISTLKQQYAKLRERQRQAHIILSAACARQSMVPPPTSQAMNHLLVGKNALVSGKNRSLGLSAATTPTKTRPVVLQGPRVTSKKERQQQVVTLHWKDTKRQQKHKFGETAAEATKCNEKLPAESKPKPETVDEVVTSPKSGLNDSDSDSTSTELCDEVDRCSDVDSEELTSASDNYYVMASEEEKSGRVEDSSTSANSPVRDATAPSRDVVAGDSPDFDDTSSSIAKITDQIRRLSAEDDNNTMVPQALLKGEIKKEDDCVKRGASLEASLEAMMIPSKCPNGVDEKRESLGSLLNDDRDYFQFNYGESINTSYIPTNKNEESVGGNDDDDDDDDDGDVGGTTNSVLGSRTKVRDYDGRYAADLSDDFISKDISYDKMEDKREKRFELTLNSYKTKEGSLDSYKSIDFKSSDTIETEDLKISRDSYRSIRSPSVETDFKVSLLSYKSLKSSIDTKDNALDTRESLKSPNRIDQRADAALRSYETLNSPETSKTRFGISLDSYKSLRSSDATNEKLYDTTSYETFKSSNLNEKRLETSLDSFKITVHNSETNDKTFQESLSIYNSQLKSANAKNEESFESSARTYANVFGQIPRRDISLDVTSTGSTIPSGQSFYASKTYVVGHLPINSPINVDQKGNTTSHSVLPYSTALIDDPVTIGTIRNSDRPGDEKSWCLEGNVPSTETTRKKSPRTPDSLEKSFSSGETMGPDSKASSMTVSPRTPIKSVSREFSTDKSVCSSISSDSKTLVLLSTTESDLVRGSPRLEGKRLSYERSTSPSTPFSTDSLKYKSDSSPKLIVSSSSDCSCSPSKMKSSERSFSSDLRSPISANSIKYTSTSYGKRGQDNISDSSIDPSTAVSPFYPIAHPNRKTPSPYGLSKRRSSREGGSATEGISPEQRFAVSKDSSKCSNGANGTNSDSGTSRIFDSKEENDISRKNSCLNAFERDKSDRRVYEFGASSILYRNEKEEGSTEDNGDDRSSEKDTVSQLPREQLNKHFMNLHFRHKDRSKLLERSSSSLDRRFADLKSSVSTDELSVSIVKKRSSDILEDMKHLEAKAFSDGPSESIGIFLGKKNSYIWEDFKNLEARRQDNFSNSASGFSRHRLDIGEPYNGLDNARKSCYVVRPKINIDESIDSILKTVSRNKINGNDNGGHVDGRHDEEDEENDGRESKLGVWTKVKPRKRGGNNGRRSSDRALKIIQENSAILQKILACQAKKRLPDLEEITKEITISPINEEISKIFSPILEKMGLNEDEISEELARINFKDFDDMTGTSISEFDAKINDELSKLSLIDETEHLDDLDVDEIVSKEYFDTREALIDRKINEELSKLLANYEEEPRLSVATLEKCSSSQNVSDTEGLDLTSISTNVFSYKSSNDSIETRSEQGSSSQEIQSIQPERYPQYAAGQPYSSSSYVRDLSPKSDIDIYRELEKLDKISSAQVIPDTPLDVPTKIMSPVAVAYVANVSPYTSDVTIRYSPKTMPTFRDASPLKQGSSYDSYKSFDFKSNLSPRRIPSNPYTPRPYDNALDSNFEYFDREPTVSTNSLYADVHPKSPILTKESLEFRVRYDDNNESPTVNITDVLSTEPKQMAMEKSVLYFGDQTNDPNKSIVGNESRAVPASSFIDYSNETSNVLRRSYEPASSPMGNYIRDKNTNYDRVISGMVESESNVGTYLRDYHPVLSPNRRFDQPFPPAIDYLASKLSPGIADETKRPVSHPDFPEKITTGGQYTESLPIRGSSCYKKSSLSLANIGRSSKSGVDNLNVSPSPKAQFNPFPVKNTSKKPKELALKLGLYSPKNSPSGPSRRS